jgi:hypothetical protein
MSRIVRAPVGPANPSYLGETNRPRRGSLPGMNEGPRTPEELETLLEDACVISEATAVAGLFEAGAVVALERHEARGDQIAAALARFAYVAQPRRILQSQDVALVIADQAVSVVRRGPDRHWRYVISLLTHEPEGSNP